jgi:N-acetylglutamate synthase-like GNAT family acetyltransferase
MNDSKTDTTHPVPSEQLYSRLATEADVETITKLINRAFAHGHTYLLEERIQAEQVEEYMRKGHFLLIEEEGQIVGLRYVEFLGDARAYIGLLSVAPDKQRRGLGRRLNEASEQFCRENGCKVIEGLVLNFNEAILEKNKRLGYKAVGTVASDNFPEYADRIPGPWHFIKIEKHL